MTISEKYSLQDLRNHHPVMEEVYNCQRVWFKASDSRDAPGGRGNHCCLLQCHHPHQHHHYYDHHHNHCHRHHNITFGKKWPRAGGDRNPLKYEGFSLDLSAHSRCFAFTFNKYEILYPRKYYEQNGKIWNKKYEGFSLNLYGVHSIHFQKVWKIEVYIHS